MNDALELAELRIYFLGVDREGDMQRRVDNDLTRLFSRHGIVPVAAWNALSGPDLPAFIYLTPWGDMAQRERSWAGFYSDPGWAEARNRTNAGGDLVTGYEVIFVRGLGAWTPTPDLEDAADPGVHELIIQDVALGHNAAAYKFIAETRDVRLRAAGAQVLGTFEVISGRPLPTVISCIRWPDFATREAAFKAAMAGPQQPPTETPLLGRRTTYLLSPKSIVWPQQGASA